MVLHDTSFDNIIYVLSYYEVSFLYLFLVKNIINKDSPGIILLSLNKYIACIFTDINFGEWWNILAVTSHMNEINIY